MSKRGTGSGPRSKCSVCGETISDVFMRTHQKTPACKTKGEVQALLKRGLVQIPNSARMIEIAQTAVRDHGLASHLIEEHFTDYTPPRFGSKSKVARTTWAPATLVEIFEPGRAYDLVDGLADWRSAYAPHYARACQDATYAARLETIVMAGGAIALRRYVETPAMRAKKLRSDAQLLRDEAARLERQAAELEA